MCGGSGFLGGTAMCLREDGSCNRMVYLDVSSKREKQEVVRRGLDAIVDLVTLDHYVLYPIQERNLLSKW